MEYMTKDNDKEICFYDDELEQAITYFNPPVEVLLRENYIGCDYDKYTKQFLEYKQGVLDANNIQELVIILNRYSDVFGDGATYQINKYSQKK